MFNIGTLSSRSLIKGGVRPGICPCQGLGEAQPLVDDQTLVLDSQFVIVWLRHVGFCCPALLITVSLGSKRNTIWELAFMA